MRPFEDWLTQPGGLADRLRALRRQANLSGKELAERTGWQQPKVSKLENGRQMPTAADVRAWAEACQASEATVAELLELVGTTDSVHVEWKRRLRRGGAAGIQGGHAALVQGAQVIRNFEPVLVPGLLQTADYARAVLTQSAKFHGTDAGDIEQAVSARLARQQVLYESGRRFQFIITEAVLHLFVAPAAAMRVQLDRLQMVIGIPHVELRVIPFHRPLMQFPQDGFYLLDNIAVVETFLGESSHTGDQADIYARAMDAMQEQSVTEDEARRLIVNAIAAVTEN